METTVKNQGNAISNATAAQKAVASAPKQLTPFQMMNAVVNTDAIQAVLKNALKENAGAFAASIIDLYNSDTTLQQCDPKQVVGECIKAISLKLPINKQLGYAWIIPYKNKNGVQIPQFQMGYKGYIQLAMRAGVYRYINADKVYEGEIKNRNKLSGAIDMSGDVVDKSKVVGYFAYFETLNGFSKTLYMDKEQLISFVERYSKSYKSGSAIWKDNFEEMALKTVLRNLLSHWGIMSTEMQTAFNTDSSDYTDQAIENSGVITTEVGEVITEATYTEVIEAEQQSIQQ